MEQHRVTHDAADRLEFQDPELIKVDCNIGLLKVEKVHPCSEILHNGKFSQVVRLKIIFSRFYNQTNCVL